MDIMKLMKQAGQLKKMQKEIASKSVSHEIDGSSLSITGTGEVKYFKLSESVYNSGIESAESTIKQLVSTCLKKQLDLQKEMAKEAMGGMNITDMLG